MNAAASPSLTATKILAGEPVDEVQLFGDLQDDKFAQDFLGALSQQTAQMLLSPGSDLFGDEIEANSVLSKYTDAVFIMKPELIFDALFALCRHRAIFHASKTGTSVEEVNTDLGQVSRRLAQFFAAQPLCSKDYLSIVVDALSAAHLLVGLKNEENNFVGLLANVRSSSSGRIPSPALIEKIAVLSSQLSSQNISQSLNDDKDVAEKISQSKSKIKSKI